jgi:hypothetical protein
MEVGKETWYEKGGEKGMVEIESEGYMVQINILELSNQLVKLHKIKLIPHIEIDVCAWPIM